MERWWHVVERENRNVPRKTVHVPLCPEQILHVLETNPGVVILGTVLRPWEEVPSSICVVLSSFAA